MTSGGEPQVPPSELLQQLRALPSFTPGREREHEDLACRHAPSSSTTASRHAAAAPRFDTRQLASVAAGVPVETAQSRQRRRAIERARAKEERAKLQAVRDAERRAAFLATSRSRECELLPNDLPATARQIVSRVERSAKSAERELLRLRRTYGSATAVAVMGTASTTRQRGRPFDALRSRRARRVVACAAAIAFLAQATKSPGRAFLVEGTLRGTLCSLFRNADTGDAVHHNTLYSTQTDSTRKGRWDCGAIVALERAGAIEKIQPPAHTQRARFVGRDRHGKPRAINQYFLRDDVVHGDDAASVEARAASSWAEWLAGRPARAARRAEVRGPPAATQL